MAWVRAQFKGKKVWAQATDGGQVLEQGGRVAIRYSDKAGARIYKAGASRVSNAQGEPRELPDGEAAADKPRTSRGSGFGSAGTRTAGQAAAAKQAAGDLVAGFSPDSVVCFTDGACRGNPGPCGAGAVVRLPDGQQLERSAALGIATNNVGELSAVGLAMDLLEEAGISGDTRIELLTDSKYTYGVLSQGWKAKANTDLILGLRQRLKAYNIQLHWIAGHVGIEANERADALANIGVNQSL